MRDIEEYQRKLEELKTFLVSGPDDDLAFTQLMRELTNASGMTVRQLSSYIDVSVQTIHRWRCEKGTKSRLTFSNLQKLSKLVAFGKGDALEQSGLSIKMSDDALKCITDTMLLAEFDFAKETNSQPSTDNLRWLSSSQTKLGFDLDHELCLSLLRKRDK